MCCLIKTSRHLHRKIIVVKLYTSKMLQIIPLKVHGWSAARRFLRRLFPLIQDAEHNIYIFHKGTRRQAVCMSNSERAAEGILDLDEELEM